MLSYQDLSKVEISYSVKGEIEKEKSTVCAGKHIASACGMFFLPKTKSSGDIGYRNNWLLPEPF